MLNGNRIANVCFRLNDKLLEMCKELGEKHKYSSMLLLGHELMEYSISVFTLLRELEANVAKYGLDMPHDRISVHFVCKRYYKTYNRIRSMFTSDIEALSAVAKEDLITLLQRKTIIREAGTMIIYPKYYEQDVRLVNSIVRKHCCEQMNVLNSIRSKWEDVELLNKRIFDILGAEDIDSMAVTQNLLRNYVVHSHSEMESELRREVRRFEERHILTNPKSWCKLLENEENMLKKASQGKLSRNQTEANPFFEAYTDQDLIQISKSSSLIDLLLERFEDAVIFDLNRKNDWHWQMVNHLCEDNFATFAKIILRRNIIQCGMFTHIVPAYEVWVEGQTPAEASALLSTGTHAPAMPGTRDGVRVEQHIHVRDMHVHGDVMADNAIKYTNHKE